MECNNFSSYCYGNVSRYAAIQIESTSKLAVIFPICDFVIFCKALFSNGRRVNTIAQKCWKGEKKNKH